MGCNGAHFIFRPLPPFHLPFSAPVYFHFSILFSDLIVYFIFTTVEVFKFCIRGNELVGWAMAATERCLWWRLAAGTGCFNTP